MTVDFNESTARNCCSSLIVMLQNALLPGHLCLVPGFPGHNALICSTISLLKVGHFDLPTPKWYWNIMDQVCLPRTFLSAKKFPPLIALNLKKVDEPKVPPPCLHQVGLISIMKKYYYMDTLRHMFSTLHHICKRSKQTQHTLCHNTSTLSCNHASIWHNLFFIDNNNCSGPDFHHQLDDFGFSIYCSCKKARRVL
jgi:hypothetical protein